MQLPARSLWTCEHISKTDLSQETDGIAVCESSSFGCGFSCQQFCSSREWSSNGMAAKNGHCWGCFTRTSDYGFIKQLIMHGAVRVRTVESALRVLAHFETALLRALGREQVAHLLVVDLQHRERHLPNTVMHAGPSLHLKPFYM